MKINRFSSTKQTIWLYVAGPSLGVIALITLGLITWKLRKKIKNCCKGSPKEESTEISSTRSVVVEVNDDLSNIEESNENSSYHSVIVNVEVQEDIRNKGPQPKMLENLGNTCYMNAILQTLAWCPYLENELEKLELNEKCEMTNSILRLLKYTHSEEPKQFDPNEVLHIAREKNNRFEGNNQQDCFEMYNTIIETMTNEIRALQEVTSTTQECSHITVQIEDIIDNSKDITQEKINRIALETMGKIDTKATNLEKAIVNGQMKTKRIDKQTMPCRRCELSGKHIKLLMIGRNLLPKNDDLGAPIYIGTAYRQKRSIPLINMLSLIEIVRKFPQSQNIDLIEKKTIRFGLQNSGIFRSCKNNINGKFTKSNHIVTYPERLNVEPFCSILLKETEADQEVSYNLFGVVSHSGSLNSGHYVAYIKTVQNTANDWYKQMQNHWTFDAQESYEDKVERKLEELKQIQKSVHVISTENRNSDKRYTYSFSTPEMEIRDEIKWYCIDDNKVECCKTKEAINNKNAYLLMYAKQRPEFS